MIGTREIRRSADGMADWLSDIRRDIHRNPELGFREERTATLVERALDELGIPHRRLAGTGVVGLIEGRDAHTRCVGLRADMDALPIQDAKTGGLRSSVDGVMHACGHDAHTTCLLGAARLLAGARDEFAGSIKLIFQPAEETDTGGALPMIEAGVLDAPHVDALFGLHVDPACEVGRIKVTDGYMQAASDMFDVVLRGGGGHGAYPHTTVDVLYAACQCISTLQSVVARNVAPLDSAVLTVGSLHAGAVRNVIPTRAKFSGTIRSLSPAARAVANDRFREITEGVCRALGAEVDIATRAGYPMLHNDPAMTDLFRAAAYDAIGDENVLVGTPSLGVEDFAYFAERRPACFFNLGVRNEARGIVHPLHAECFDIDESALPIGTALLAAAAVAFLHIQR